MREGAGNAVTIDDLDRRYPVDASCHCWHGTNTTPLVVDIDLNPGFRRIQRENLVRVTCSTRTPAPAYPPDRHQAAAGITYEGAADVSLFDNHRWRSVRRKPVALGSARCRKGEAGASALPSKNLQVWPGSLEDCCHLHHSGGGAITWSVSPEERTIC